MGPGRLLVMAGYDHRVREIVIALAILIVGVLMTSLPALDIEELPDNSAAKLTVLGNGVFLRGQYQTAVSYYEQARERDRSYFYAAFNLGLTHHRLAVLSDDQATAAEHYRQARMAFQQAAELRRDNPEVHSSLGLLAFETGDVNLAVSHFQAAINAASQGDERAGYYYNLATALERLNDEDGAQRAYEQCLELNPQHFNALYNLGTLHLRRNAPRAAERLLRQAREANPRRPEPLLNLALLAERHGNEDPLPLLDAAVQAATNHHPRLLTRALWHRASYFQRATIAGVPTKIRMKNDLEEILRHDPEFPQVNTLLGEYHESLAEYDRAIAYYEREIAADHDHPAALEARQKAHFRLSIIYSQHRRHPDKALAHVEAYYQLRPDASDALRERALGILNDGDGPAREP